MESGHKRIKKGFTLIELSLAVAFISVLLLTVTLITNEIIQIYRKGYSIKAINQVGRDLIDEFQSSIVQSPPASISSFCSDKYRNDDTQQSNCENTNHGFYSIYQQFYASVKVTSGKNNANAKQVPVAGIFCSGKYTYLWNTGYLFNFDDYIFNESGNQKELREKHTLKIRYQYRREDGTTATTTTGYGQKGEDAFRLIKIEDTSGSICTNTLEGNYPSAAQAIIGPGGTGNYVIEIPYVLSGEPEELLSKTDADLALYDLVVFEPARVAAAERLLFSGSFILGTINSGVDIMSSSNSCQAPSYFSSDFSYCAINKFNFTIQSSGK